MKTLGIAALCFALAVPLGAAAADPPWKEKGGKGGEYKVEYDDGNCKVERKWGKKGDYKEEIKCRGMRRPPGHHDLGPGGPPGFGQGGPPGYYGYGYR